LTGGVVVEPLPPPPHPVLNAAAAISTRPRQVVTQAPRAVSLLLKKKSGSRRIGSRIPAVAAPGRVSVKTTVTWYVPAGVVEEVAIVTALAVEEYVQVAPVGRFRQETETLVADEGKVTE
jgi:hypothetical protein